MSLVSFSNADVYKIVKHKRLLKHFIPTVFTCEKRELEQLSIVFCSDEYLLSLNKQFLHHDYFTDILTFDLSNRNKVSGEIYISLDRVADNSSVHHARFQQELERVIFHGVLHLCGFSDKTVIEKNTMTQKENYYLFRFYSFHVKQKI